MTIPIAIVGMGAILPGAMDLSECWSNILAAKDCIDDIPSLYWDIEDFYDPNPLAPDKSYSYKAGAIGEAEFDSIGFGISPLAMESISVEQLYALVVARQALLDADMIGANARKFNREKTGVILAAGIGKNAFSLSRRQDIPRTRKILENSGVPAELIERILERLKNVEIEWTEDSEPGYLANVTAGRIASRFDFNGTNCAVDAACASSLAALKFAVGELYSGDCDVVLTGGVNLDLTASAFISFCKTPAISKIGISRPFDADADGMILGDGVAMVVLKRLEDAERDNDRIYAVIKSVGSSGDGRAKSIFAPTMEGQSKALMRAYEKTDVHPSTISLIEAHGTSTHVGDGCELSTLKRFFEGSGAEQNAIAIGSIKSQIGHTRLTAGMAGLIKTALSLYHRTIPPTLNVSTRRADMIESAFYTTPAAKPWTTSKRCNIRRAGVSSFGFGGTNFHTVLEEYKGDSNNWRRLHRIPSGICLDASDSNELIAVCESWIEYLNTEPAAYDVLLDSQRDVKEISGDRPRIGFVSGNADEAKHKLRVCADMLKKSDTQNIEEAHLEAEGIYFRTKGIAEDAKVVTLFPGQGSQYIGMMDEIARDYPEMSEFLELCGHTLESRGLRPIADILYSGDLKISQMEAEASLKDTKYTQPALAAVCGGMYEILRNRGYTEDFIIGHSFGEIAGLWASGVIDKEAFIEVACARGHAMSEVLCETGMIAVSGDIDSCRKWIQDYDNLYIANENSDLQTVVSGNMEQIKKFAAKLSEMNVVNTILKVSQAFHSPYMTDANKAFCKTIDNTKFSALKKKLYNGASSKFYKQQAALVKETLAKQMELTVHFAGCIRDAYKKGARVFIEIGPGKVLTNLTNKILEGKEYYALAVNRLGRRKNVHVQLEETLVHLRVLGVKVGGDLYRMSTSEVYKSEKPKSSYVINPMLYMTPKKREVAEAAIEVIDPLYDFVPVHSAESNENISVLKEEASPYYEVTTLGNFYDLGGELEMRKDAMESIFDLQSLNTKALENFLTSQENQIKVFKELFTGSAGSPASSDALKLIGAFQNNSLRAFEAYMHGQQGIMGGIATMPKENAVYRQIEPQPIEYNEYSSNDAVTHVEKDIHKDMPLVRRAESIVLNNTVSEPTPVSVQAIENVAALERPPVQNSAPALTGFDPVAMIIRIISEKSGYPEELLDADMNIESDLGIDSIKKIEVFSELNKQIPGGLDNDDVEAIAMLQTISEIGDYILKKK
ncbi:MAG: acyltransferase domain-containing protein [Firmicutes bacterium]|nr:acyltransferase domain-containing protein [Bacillota bacterium]